MHIQAFTDNPSRNASILTLPLNIGNTNANLVDLVGHRFVLGTIFDLHTFLLLQIEVPTKLTNLTIYMQPSWLQTNEITSFMSSQVSQCHLCLEHTAAPRLCFQCWNLF